MKKEELDKKTPQWFRTWNDRCFRPVKQRSVKNERMLFVLIAGVFGLNLGDKVNIDTVSIAEFFVSMLQAVGGIGG